MSARKLCERHPPVWKQQWWKGDTLDSEGVLQTLVTGFVFLSNLPVSLEPINA